MNSRQASRRDGRGFFVSEDRMTYWTWGVNFGGSEKSHYSFMLRERIVIGRTDDTPYEVGDLVAITKGQGLLAIARIDEPPRSITEIPRFSFVESKYDITFMTSTIFAKATLHKVFPIQQGALKIKDDLHQTTIRLLWNHLNKKLKKSKT
jgi:hypothetical protein